MYEILSLFNLRSRNFLPDRFHDEMSLSSSLCAVFVTKVDNNRGHAFFDTSDLNELF